MNLLKRSSRDLINKTVVTAFRPFYSVGLAEMQEIREREREM